MPSYQAYPKSQDTPNRKNRKSSRNVVFQKNRKANKPPRKVTNGTQG